MTGLEHLSPAVATGGIDFVLIIAGLLIGRVTSPSTKNALLGVLFIMKVVKYYLDTHPHGQALAKATDLDETINAFKEKHEPMVLMTPEEAGGVG